MMRKLICIVASAAFVASCVHTNTNSDPVIVTYGPTLADRQDVAAQTCEAQYVKHKQNYLSAVQTVIANGWALPNANNAPLDRFRAEVNAAYNTVVMRCKTHTHCLEVHNYDEAQCYMSASDRKDAERRFSDLAEDLRRIEREHHAHKGKGKKKKRKGGNVNVTVTQEQNNDQSQTNDNHNGDVIEDQDVLILCKDAKNLLDRRCREGCRNCDE